jgi:hypothetical protein
MVRDHLDYKYTGATKSFWMSGEEIDDGVIIGRMGEIFKDIPPFTPCPVEEYSASRPPNEVIVVKIAREY